VSKFNFHYALLTSSITCNQNLFELFIFFNSGMGISVYEGPRLDITREFMLDWSAFQEVKLDTELVTSLGRDIVELSPHHLGSSTSTFQHLQQVATDWFDISAGQPCISASVYQHSCAEFYL
jgi:hypothetical protein